MGNLKYLAENAEGAKNAEGEDNAAMYAKVVVMNIHLLFTIYQ